MDEMHSRRKFIHKFLYAGALSLGGAWVLGSCSSENAGQENTGADSADALAEVTSCDDLSGISASEIVKREKLAYVEKTPIPDSYCGNCSLYIPPAAEGACGGCMLFKGPVFAEAYCTYWAPIA